MFLVERYWPGISRERLADAEERMSRAARDLAGSGVEIRILSSMLIPAEEVVLTLFGAADEEDVIEVSRLSEVPFDRVQPVEMSQIHSRGGSDEDHD
jgi:Protein of unknown function (DUF4242)